MASNDAASPAAPAEKPAPLRPENSQFLDDEFKGPVTTRRCTDVFCLFLLFLGWLAMTIIGWAALGVWHVDGLHKGDHLRLLHGMDYRGKLCGVDDTVKDLPMKWDPNYNYITPDSNGDLVPSELGICVKTCPVFGESRCDPYHEYGCWSPMVSTSKSINFCIPIDTKRAVNFAKDTFEDFYRAAATIGILGFLISSIASFAFIAVVRIPFVLRLAVWLSILIVLIICIIGSVFMLYQAHIEDEKDSSEKEAKVQIQLMRALGSILAIVGFLWLCLAIFLRKKIAIAIDLIRETSKAIVDMPILMFSPILNSIILFLFSIVWIIYCCYLATSGEILDTTSSTLTGTYTYKRPHINNKTKKALLFVCFIWLWTIAFIQGAGQFICSHSVLVWYFKHKKESLSSSQLFSSTQTFLRYHTGTIAYGSFILAVVQFIRAVLTYIKTKMEGKDTKLVKCALCCCSCCLWCLEKFIKFVDKHAYIQCAMNGTPFCHSARRAFGLLVRNLAQLGTISVLSSMVIGIGKLTVTMTCSGIAYYYMRYKMHTSLHGYIVPTLFTAVIAYACASVFLDTISITSDTMLQGFLVDEEMKRNSRRGLVIDRNDSQVEIREFMYKRQETNPDLFKLKHQTSMGGSNVSEMAVSELEDDTKL